MQARPTASCLCVTENRSAFIPWLLWSFERQTYADRELVILDSSKPGIQIDDVPRVRVVRAEPGSSIPAKRNIALREAAGSIVAWFDDDDWQHPERLSRLVEAISQGAPIAGSPTSYFVDLGSERCARYAGGKSPIFNSCGFPTDVAREVAFDEKRLRGSDSVWMRALSRRHACGRQLVDGVLSMWLCHDANISNPRRRRRFRAELDAARKAIGAEAWADTDEQLDSLRERLGMPFRRRAVAAVPEAPGRAAAKRPERPNRRRKEVIAAGARTNGHPALPVPSTPPLDVAPAEPGVSIAIKVTTLDGAFAGTMIPHMIAQAKYPFAERIVVVDTPRAFTGKYARRASTSTADLERTLEQLLSDNVIDRVVRVDYSQEMVQATMRAYFGRSGERAPTHGAPGCPIYSTLVALEAVKTDHVVQMDADMLFHASGGSWVEHGLRILAADPSAWLVMTQAGPPAGPPGTPASLGRANARRATWDEKLGCWRFKTASTRYFLTDRRRLRGRLPLIRRGMAAAPLEQCISRALQQHGAYRANLAIPGSWDLHVLHHEQPFPEWAERLVRSAEEGKYPPMQAGNYDLRLDQRASVEAWRKLLDGETRAAPTPQGIEPAPPIRAPAVESVATRAIEDGTAATCLISIVIPVRDRAGARVENALASLAWQTAGRPAEIVLASHGSQPDIDADLRRLCDRRGAQLLQLADPSAPWCKPFALNSAIRATNADVPFIVTMDVDMILAPNFLGVVLEVLRRDEKALALCRSSDLESGVTLPLDSATLQKQLPDLKRSARLRGRFGCGGIQAARRSLFFELRGYDEDLVWWGAEDGDLVKRSAAAGYRAEWIESRTYMLHQWHPKRHAALPPGAAREGAIASWSTNHRLARSKRGAVRNPESWGGAA